jgi:hypothetical protein
MRSEARLAKRPPIGPPTLSKGTRERPIRRTPFTRVYRIMPDRVEILRIPDQRSGASKD